MRLTVLALLVGCSRTVGVATDAGADSDPYVQTLPNGPCAVEGVTGTVPGITLAIRSSSCVYKRGTPATFTYEVTASASAPAIRVPDSGGGCSRCRAYTSDPISFTGYVIYGMSSTGTEQRYCVCDSGCCPPTQTEVVQLNATTSTMTIEWSGRTWDGPSDTNNVMGDAFLSGRYAVHVGFAGFDQGNVEASLPIEVIP